MDPLLLCGILVSLIFCFFFSAIETTYNATNKLQLELEGRLGRFSPRIMSLFAKQPSWFIGTAIVGSTVSLIAFSVLTAVWLIPILQKILPSQINTAFTIISIQIIVSTGLVLFVVAVLPKSLSILNPNQLLSSLGIPFMICFFLFFIVTFPLVSLSRFFMSKDENPIPGRTDVNRYLKEMQHIKTESEDIALDKKIFHNALEFKTVKIRDCMIPRTEITAVEINDSIEKLREAFVESGHSKVIVYKQSIDEITGYCHSSSLFKKPEQIKDILTPIIIVAETALANELMIRFINERKSLAVVVDEFGGTSGIVSMEDIIEEIFGDIEDEHDEEDNLVEQKLDERTYLLSARLEIDYLNDTYAWNLPTGEYETLGGLILSHTEDFPKQGQMIVIAPFTFIIQTTGDNRIDTVMLMLET
ncbi:MAG: hemolysin [Marivirga sp.]|nr:hemolysin [Marivirga sp.]